MQQQQLGGRLGLRVGLLVPSGLIGLIKKRLGRADASDFSDLEGDARFEHTKDSSAWCLLPAGLIHRLTFSIGPLQKESGGPDSLIPKPKERCADDL
jgi:hypothetical protein